MMMAGIVAIFQWGYQILTAFVFGWKFTDIGGVENDKITIWKQLSIIGGLVIWGIFTIGTVLFILLDDVRNVIIAFVVQAICARCMAFSVYQMAAFVARPMLNKIMK